MLSYSLLQYTISVLSDPCFHMQLCSHIKILCLYLMTLNHIPNCIQYSWVYFPEMLEMLSLLVCWLLKVGTGQLHIRLVYWNFWWKKMFFILSFLFCLTSGLLFAISKYEFSDVGRIKRIEQDLWGIWRRWINTCKPSPLW